MEGFSLKKMNGFLYVPLAFLFAFGIAYILKEMEFLGKRKDSFSLGLMYMFFVMPIIFISALLFRFTNKLWGTAFLILSLVTLFVFDSINIKKNQSIHSNVKAIGS